MDSRRPSGFDDPYIPGPEAAALLEVKRETIYAYAGRGLIRTVPGEDARSRRYHRGDLDRLRARSRARAGHAAVAAGALRWGEPVLDTAITAITTAGPMYRGTAATDLASKMPFEPVAELLWSTEPATGSPPSSARWPRIP